MLEAGLIVNPVAGTGGPKGLKGSDGSLAGSALEMGAVLISGQRAAEALKSLIIEAQDELIQLPMIMTCSGKMGEDSIKQSGYKSFTVVYEGIEPTSGRDTTSAARVMKEKGADLIIFSGGDGTARDVVEGVGEDFPVIGIPAGVKMYTGIFLNRPSDLGKAVLDILNKGLRTTNVELLDFDRAADGPDMGVGRYGKATVPLLHSIQAGKSEYPTEEEDLEGIRSYLVDNMDNEIYYVMGTGSTVKNTVRMLGYMTPILGVDIFLGKRLVASDVTDTDLLSLLHEGRRIRVILTPLGGNGFILGRGNQQISPAFIASMKREDLIVVASREKINRLGVIRVDTGDALLDSSLKGPVEVITGYASRKICEIV